MDEYEDLDMYDGNPVHDMNMDFDRYINTGELSELFEEPDLDELIDNLNDWDLFLCIIMAFISRYKPLPFFVAYLHPYNSEVM